VWRRRETPAGPWLPESPEPQGSPESDAERGEAVERAVLVLLGKLTAGERAAYVLREIFDYPYDRVANLLHLGAANCRQLVRRARQRVASDWRRPVSVTAQQRFLEAFLAAAHDGNIAALEDLLAADAAAAVALNVGSDGDDDPAAA